MFQLRVVVLVSAVLLLCGGLGEVDSKRTNVLERFSGNYGYFITPVDKTSFTVDHPIWLKQFDLPKVFGYHAKSKKNINNVPATVKVIEMGDEQRELFVGQIKLNSGKEANVKITKGVLLQPNVEYIIQVETPEDTHLMINETFAMRTLTIHRIMGKPIHVKFQQRNPTDKPSFDEKTKRKPSNGLVRRLHMFI